MKYDKPIFIKILAILSYMFLSFAIVLEILSRKSMLVHRDLIYRNQFLKKYLFNDNILKIYYLIILLSVVIFTIKLIKNNNKYYYKSLNNISSKILFISILLFLMLIYLKNSTMLAFYLILISVGFILLIKYIEYIYIKIVNSK